jgi:hypothetical protein
MGDACGRCGGKGWRWTGVERVPCTARGCLRQAPPADPIRVGNVDMVPVADWLAPGGARDRLGGND